MKKSGIITGMALASLIGVGTYMVVNKNTKVKVDKLINTALDKANKMTSNMMN